ncbi:hypothetical protein TBLA_0J01320 [Henningerozyma blattae CBS 6284]|uniref:HORMA domain-containing protein n=1 Tax=Henningerozyma blattae (strain ATCC 34711 / CBS 6284 / DSM 70876 / NBRC 10599 / NRRL Y-10934 / UCD 77-7) TaxID=1071380 RepID=I2H9S6_HENB6|nr:hypothetical protein TBLA_0J01320 [Tetrapisispora blattae CBS 6284]CCH63128.1 hypothetical protein TBLA_0J01320 [Tetrapisispora blattae CBS 6284]
MSTSQYVKTQIKNPNVAQKQSTSNSTDISTEQSQRLIQTMLTMSFGCLTFLRGLFPDDNFADQRFVPEKIEKNYNKDNVSHANSIRIKTLKRGKSNEADILLDWLEKGVFKSLKLKYLKGLSFGIFLDENNPSSLIENYIFTFEYGKNDNGIKMSIKNDTSSNESISLLDSRIMVQQLMRRFIILTQSLEPLPQKKYISMHLIFNSNTPQSYQPSNFKDATYEEKPTIKIPTNNLISKSSTVGSLETKCHQVEITVLSTNESDLTNPEVDCDVIEPISRFCLSPDQISGSRRGTINGYDTQSQTGNILGNVLQSSQTSVQPTQYVAHQERDTECECGVASPAKVTSTKICKICKKKVHGFCYGNIRENRVPACFMCCFGPELESKSSEFKDLMTLRKCYRTLSKKRSFPPSVMTFAEYMFRKEDITDEIKNRIAFAITIFFSDNTLSAQGNTDQTGSQALRPNFVSIDIPGIAIPNFGELKEGQTTDIRFTLRSENSRDCYTTDIPYSKKQIKKWLDEVLELSRQSIQQLQSGTFGIDTLEITDNTETQDPIEVNQKKRTRINLEGYIDDSSPSVNDTSIIEKETPRKIPKISVSKKLYQVTGKSKILHLSIEI